MNRAVFLVLAFLGSVHVVSAAEASPDTSGGKETVEVPSPGEAGSASETPSIMPEPASTNSVDQVSTNEVEGAEQPSDWIPEQVTVVTNIMVIQIPAPPSPSAAELIKAAMETLGPAVDTLSLRLGAIEQTMSTQQQRSLEAGQATTRAVLLVAACFALALLLGALMAALILSRSVQRVSDVLVAALAAARQLSGGGNQLALSESGDMAEGTPAPLEQVTSRFMGAIEKLEKRMVELEHSAASSSFELGGHAGGGGDAAGAGGGNGGPLEFSVSALHQKQYGGGNGPGAEQAASAVADPVHVYIGKGQALLNLGQAEDALACFEKALEMNPKHADAYVKRGIALEKLEKMEAALESYDRAIAVDASLTLAYLYKGAVCNRLQRFREALDCYDSALKCEQRLAS